MKLAAVIRITPYNESIENAIQTIIKSKKYFCHVYVVSQGGAGIISTKYAESLERAGITSIVVRKIPELPHNGIDGILEIPPNCYCDPLAIGELIETSESQGKNVNLTHFSLATDVEDKTFSIAYGWLFVLYLIEWAWWTYERYKLPLDRFIRLTYVVKKGSRRLIAPKQFAWRFYNTGQYATISCPGLVHASLDDNLRGWEFVKNSIYRHELVGNLWCWLGNMWVLSWWFFYWGSVVNLLVRGKTLVLVYCGVHVTLTAIIYMIMNRRTNIKGDWLMCFLHPLYIISFPIVLVWGRLSRPRTFWADQRKKQNRID